MPIYTGQSRTCTQIGELLALVGGIHLVHHTWAWFQGHLCSQEHISVSVSCQYEMGMTQCYSQLWCMQPALLRQCQLQGTWMTTRL